MVPTDEGAAAWGFEATVDGVRYVSRAMVRDEALRQYDDALEAVRGGFLLDEERADVVIASLGDLKPGAVVAPSITYATELLAEGAAARFMLPTPVSSRCAPASDRTGVVADASRGSEPSRGDGSVVRPHVRDGRHNDRTDTRGPVAIAPDRSGAGRRARTRAAGIRYSPAPRGHRAVLHLPQAASRGVSRPHGRPSTRARTPSPVSGLGSSGRCWQGRRGGPPQRRFAGLAPRLRPLSLSRPAALEERA